MLATEYAEYYGMDPQGKDEDDMAFRKRVALKLRQDGKLVEAHEAMEDERYEESGNVVDGIFGAIAQALSDTHYGGNPLDNDIVAGKYVRYQMSRQGQRDLETRELMAKLLMAGLSPDDITSLL